MWTSVSAQGALPWLDCGIAGWRFACTHGALPMVIPALDDLQTSRFLQTLCSWPSGAVVHRLAGLGLARTVAERENVLRSPCRTPATTN
jgi:hypothetical protein